MFYSYCLEFGYKLHEALSKALIHVIAIYCLERDPKKQGSKIEWNNILSNIVYKWIHFFPKDFPLILGQSLMAVCKNYEDDLRWKAIGHLVAIASDHPEICCKIGGYKVLIDQLITQGM